MKAPGQTTGKNMDDKKPAQGFWGAVESVVDYLFYEELRHFLDTPPEERKGHIFESVIVLSCCLNLAREERQLIRYDS
jgi:hypothetical protein